MYSFIFSDRLKKKTRKLAKKDKAASEALYKKIQEILENPYHYKPLGAPMQGLRRVHIMGCFVLTYGIDEKNKVVNLEDFAHHDEAYH